MSQNMVDVLKRKISAKNITAMILFGAIVMVFVFFGMPSKMGGQLGFGAVAVVNDTLISASDFQQEEQQMLQYYSKLFGSSMDFSSQRQLLKNQAIEKLIRSELVTQAAQKEMILATDKEIRDFIVKDIPFFQQSGQFIRENYMRYLEATKMKPGEFENKIKKDVQNVRIHRLMEIAHRPIPAEKDFIKSSEGLKMNYEFVQLNEEDVKKNFKDQSTAKLQAVSDAVRDGNEAILGQLMKEMSLKWEETGFVDASAEMLPKIQSQSARDAVDELSKDQKFLKRMIIEGQKRYIIKLKEFKKEAKLAAQINQAGQNEMDERQRAEGVFEAWLGGVRKSSKIEVNTELIKN